MKLARFRSSDSKVKFAWRAMNALIALGLTIALEAGADDKGWLIGGGWGEADYHYTIADFDDGSVTSGEVDSHELAWKLFAGYRFNRHFSIEAGYIDLTNDFDPPSFEGTSDGSGSRFVSVPDGPVSVAISPSGIVAAGLGSLDLGSRIYGFGKVGLMRWEADITFSDLRGEIRYSDRGTDLFFGAGVEYRLESGLAFRVEWELFVGVVGRDTDLWTANIAHTF